MLTIISPAKTLDFKTESYSNQFTMPDLLNDSKILIDELRKLNPTDIVDLMKVNKDIATLNFERNLSWKTPFTLSNAKQAILAFKGQVYVGLDAKSLSENDLLYSQNHFRILSGLYGILRPMDLIQAYRLEMGTSLTNPRGKNLYEFWGDKITDSINKELTTHKHKTLVNLASNEYYKALKSKNIKGNIITPVFKESKGNDYKVVTVYAKTARGLMSRFIIKNQIDSPEDLKAFDTEGYFYNSDLSSENQWVFTR